MALLTYINRLYPSDCDNIRYGSDGPLVLQLSRLNYTYMIYIDIYTLDTFNPRSHAPGFNAHALHSVYPFTY